MDMKIRISNQIEIIGAEARVIEMCKKTLELSNPMYYKLMRMSGNKARAFYGVKPILKYWKEEKGSIIISRGMKKRLLDWLKKCNIDFTLEENYIDIPIKDDV